MSTRSETLVAPNPSSEIAIARIDKDTFVTLADFHEIDCLQPNENKSTIAPNIRSQSKPSTSREVHIAIAVLAIVHLIITCVLVVSW